MELEEDDEATLLRALLQRVLRHTRTREPEPAPRSTINRFLPRAAPAVTPPAATEANTPLVRDSPASEASAAASFPKFKPRAGGKRPSAWKSRVGPWGRGLSYLLGAVLLASLAFYVGRYDAARSIAGAVGTVDPVLLPWQPAYFDEWSKVRAADHAGDLATASRLMNDLSRRTTLSPALRAYQATIQTRLGYTTDVEADLMRLTVSNASPDVSIAVNTAHGFNLVRRRQFAGAADCFAAVARVDAFDVLNLLRWGQALRREGNFPEATDRFRDALARLPSNAAAYPAAQREYIAYLLRLTQLEAGREADVSPELDRQLNAPAPSGYWLLTAAAAALQKGDMTSAVDALKKARASFPPELFSSLLDDYFFRSFSSHSEMNAFLNNPSPSERLAKQASMEYFIDP